MIGKPLTKTASLLEKRGRRRKIEISVKRRFYRDPNSGLLVPIDTNPQDAKFYSNYYFEVVKHDLHLAFAPRKNGLPFVRIGLPGEDAVWYLWFVGWDDYNPRRPIQPEVIDHGEGFVEWRLDADTRMRIEILGHLIRKLIIVERRPAWNRLRFRIGRAGAILIDGAAVGVPQRRLIAFRKGASWDDNPIFWFSEPKAWDSQADVPATVGPDYTLTPITDALWGMEIALDPDWLDNAQYPVYIDPTIILQPGPEEGMDNFFYHNPTANYGTNNILNLEYNTYNDGDIPPFNLGQILFKFNLSAISSGSNINSALLEIYKYGGGDYNITSDVLFYPWRLLKDWKEMTSNPTYYDTDLPWDEYKANSIGGDIDNYVDPPHSMMSIGSSTRGSAHQIELTGTIQNIVNAGFNYGFKLATENVYIKDDAVRYLWFYSSDHEITSYHPKLIIDYTEGGIFIPAKIGAIAGKGTLTPLASA